MKKSKSKSNNTLSYSLMVIAGMVALFFGYKYLINVKQLAQINEVNTFPGFTPSTTFLSFSDPTLTLNQKNSVKLVIDSTIWRAVTTNTNNVDNPDTRVIGSGNYKLVAATVELNYDPNSMTITDVVKGDFFSNTLSAPKIDPVAGKVIMSFGITPGQGGKEGKGVLATLNIEPKTAKPSISFVYNKQCPPGQMCMTNAPLVTNTDIRAEGYEGNVFEEYMRNIKYKDLGLSYIFYAISPNPTSTPIPTPKINSDIVDTGDTAGDEVNAQDYAQLVINFNKTGTAGWIRSDINKDGKVNIADFAQLIKDWKL